jgi:geranylgeranyl pyrophosphate synthase
LGGGGDGPRKLAAAVEFIHSATLLHDDVVDVSSRAIRPACWSATSCLRARLI